MKQKKKPLKQKNLQNSLFIGQNLFQIKRTSHLRGSFFVYWNFDNLKKNELTVQKNKNDISKKPSTADAEEGFEKQNLV